MSRLITRTPPWPRGLEPLRVLAVALQFLTRLPVPQIPVVDGDLRRATAAFPLVGVVVAACTWLVFAGVHAVLGPAPAAVTAVAAGVAVTGAFHEDGLADTFDGLWGGWDPEQRLTIMRDSRLGTYGAAALVLVLVGQVVLLADAAPLLAARALLAGHVLGRAAILLQIRVLPPVADQGSGAKVADPITGVGRVFALTVTAIALVAATGLGALVLVLLGLVAVGSIRRAARRKLGGLTGDILGATQQVALLLGLAGTIAMDGAGWTSWA